MIFYAVYLLPLFSFPLSPFLTSSVDSERQMQLLSLVRHERRNNVGHVSGGHSTSSPQMWSPPENSRKDDLSGFVFS